MSFDVLLILINESLHNFGAKIQIVVLQYLKGLDHDWATFVYNFFLPQTLYISSLKRTTIFKLIVHGIELRA